MKERQYRVEADRRCPPDRIYASTDHAKGEVVVTIPTAKGFNRERSAFLAELQRAVNPPRRS